MGPNGSGKSKLLEAIFLLTNGLPPKDRSFGDFVPE
ncbi:hypothetical protein KC711_05745 [Candidatus Peregrinibacteria bacterium]|nr:hypothetical protein [Candidatus Peregrinibacteria bacterium]MCB9805134.1 hypothetical protein [Candidatus Peribacteria bacterium]